MLIFLLGLLVLYSGASSGMWSGIWLCYQYHSLLNCYQYPTKSPSRVFQKIKMQVIFEYAPYSILLTINQIWHGTYSILNKNYGLVCLYRVNFGNIQPFFSLFTFFLSISSHFLKETCNNGSHHFDTNCTITFTTTKRMKV